MPSPTSFETRITRDVSISASVASQFVDRRRHVAVGAQQVGDPQRQAVDEDHVVVPRRRLAGSPRASSSGSSIVANLPVPLLLVHAHPVAHFGVERLGRREIERASRPPASPGVRQSRSCRCARRPEPGHVRSSAPPPDATHVAAQLVPQPRAARMVRPCGMGQGCFRPEIHCVFDFRQGCLWLYGPPAIAGPETAEIRDSGRAQILSWR